MTTPLPTTVVQTACDLTLQPVSPNRKCVVFGVSKGIDHLSNAHSPDGSLVLSVAGFPTTQVALHCQYEAWAKYLVGRKLTWLRNADLFLKDSHSLEQFHSQIVYSQIKSI